MKLSHIENILNCLFFDLTKAAGSVKYLREAVLSAGAAETVAEMGELLLSLHDLSAEVEAFEAAFVEDLEPERFEDEIWHPETMPIGGYRDEGAG